MKDHFSTQSHLYARYRPVYPEALYTFLLSLVPATQHAWDCGTGNGQVAKELAKHFKKVYATDISPQQLQNAAAHPAITYSVQRAEQCTFADNFFDLITVAQAIHWFDIEGFYREVRRTIKDRGILAVIGYGLQQISPEIDTLIAHFYYHTLSTYWDKEMRYIDEQYQTLPFPFVELKAPTMEMTLEWTFEHLIGFLDTWSAVKKYTAARGQNPVADLYEPLKKSWGEAPSRTVRFPLLLRLARIEK